MTEQATPRPGDMLANGATVIEYGSRWAVLAVWPESHHPYVVWHECNPTPDGWQPASGQYFATISDAVEYWVKL